jgi:hypothetical protein
MTCSGRPVKAAACPVGGPRSALGGDAGCYDCPSMCSCSALRLSVGSLVRPAPKLEVADTYAASCRRCGLAVLLLVLTLCAFVATAYYFRTSPTAVPTITPLNEKLRPPYANQNCQGLSRPPVAGPMFSTGSVTTYVDPSGHTFIVPANASCQLTYSVAAGPECDASKSYAATEVNALIMYGAEICNSTNMFVRKRSNFSAVVDTFPFPATLSCSVEIEDRTMPCPRPLPNNLLYYFASDIITLDGKRLACVRQQETSNYSCYDVSLQVTLPMGLIDCVRPSS